MKRFVIFGMIEYIDNTALVHAVLSAHHMDDADIEPRAAELGCDFIAPHYSDLTINFMQYHEEIAE
jgi:hypothetical protein